MIRIFHKVVDMNKSHLWTDLGGTLNSLLMYKRNHDPWIRCSFLNQQEFWFHNH